MCCSTANISGVPGSVRVAGRESIGSSTSFSSCGPIGICSLSYSVTHSGSHQRRHQLAFDEKQASFIVQLDLTVVWNMQCARVSAKVTPIALFCKTSKGENGFLHIARVKKNSDRSSLSTLESNQTSSVVFEPSSARCVDSRVCQ